MKKVFLVNPPCRDQRYNRFPLGLGYLAANIADICDVKVVNLENTKKDYINFLNVLIFEKADVIGISCTSLNVMDVLELTREIKLLRPNVIIFLGGPQPTAQPKETIQSEKSIDFLIVGQGEEILRKFIIALNNGESVDNIEGIVDTNTFSSTYSLYDKVVRSKIDGGKYDFPMKYLTVKPRDIQKKYGLHHVPGSILTARGCANQCSFCTVSLGKELCFTPIDRVLEEVSFLHEEYGVTELIINDADFLAYSSRAIEIIQRIKSLGFIKKISLNACVSSVIKIQKELDAILNGMEWEFEIGIESVCDEQLLRYNKKATTEQNFLALDILVASKNKYNIKINLDMILFDPYSSLSDFKQFIWFIERYKLFENSEYEDILTSITFLFPGTKLREQAINDGLARNSLGTASFVFRDSKVAILYSYILYFYKFVMPDVYEIRSHISGQIASDISHSKRITLFGYKKKYDKIMFEFFKEALSCIDEDRNINELLKTYIDQVNITKEEIFNSFIREGQK